MANAFGNAGWCGARTRSKRSLLIEIAVYPGARYSANRTGDTKSIQHCEVRRYWANFGSSILHGRDPQEKIEFATEPLRHRAGRAREIGKRGPHTPGGFVWM